VTRGATPETWQSTHCCQYCDENTAPLPVSAGKKKQKQKTCSEGSY
jgi:hypothetical protein